MNKVRKPTVIDLFSGCGGLSLGFEQANYDIVLGIDNWQDALSTFSFNHPLAQVIKCDLYRANVEEIKRGLEEKKIDVIIGGPPCQGFSIAGKRLVEDERNKLYLSFVEFVRHLKPRVFVMENVPNIVSMGNGILKEKIVSDFTSLGYTVSVKVLLASDYGVPQNRKRAFFIGILGNKTFDFLQIKKSIQLCSADAISDLPEGSLEDGSKYPNAAKTEYQKMMRNKSKGLFNHQITNHEEKTKRIIAMVPDGGNYKDLPKKLQNLRNVHIAWTRLKSSKPSFTIDTGHRHHFHYLHNRVPTVRESARIQSFPDTFIFQGSKTSQYMQVGNAVPPLLAKGIAKALIDFL